ncbi:MAG: PKD domain-containing protein [Bacteroidia bacterium]
MSRKVAIWNWICRGMVLFVLLYGFSRTSAQPCSGAPSFTIDLSGNPDSTWNSVSVIRSGYCCGSLDPDRCIEFILTLDSNSTGIRFDIASGALPPGALYYQIGCGISYPVGQDICLNGPGPHRITFCKPGNNINVYQIKAIPKPAMDGKLIINEACIGFLKAYGLVDTSITWQSVPSSATYDSYLSCTEDCDSVSIIPTGNYPPTVTYRVCGRIMGGCGGTMFCDTATVRFVTNIDVDILPDDPTVCFGGTTASITATPMGGLPPFRYSWNTGDTTQLLNVDTGIYYVTMIDSLGCTVARDTVLVRGFSVPIEALAGNDTALCTRQNFAFLRGEVRAVNGGRWINGEGTFNPDDSVLHTTYYPSVNESTAGIFTLKLITTGNGTCPADTDEVQITIKPSPVPVINGPDSICAYAPAVYSTAFHTGETYSWSVSGGTILGSSTDTSLQVIWGISGTGNVQLNVLLPNGCDSTVNKSVLILPAPIPVISGDDTLCQYDAIQYSCSPAAGVSCQWSVSGGTIQGSASDSILTVIWNTSGTGSVSLYQTTALGCDSSVFLNIVIHPRGIPVIAGPDSVCAFKQSIFTTTSVAGYNRTWVVTGGTISGSVTDTFIQVSWNNAGTGQVTLTLSQIAGCDSTVVKSIIINPTPIPEITGPFLVCTGKTAVYHTVFQSGIQYAWTVTGGQVVGSLTDTLLSVIWQTPDSGFVQLKTTSGFGCDSILKQIVHIRPTPAVWINGPVLVCSSRNALYYSKYITGSNYNWNVSGGTFQTLHDSMIQVSWGNTGIGQVSLQVISPDLCDSIFNLPVIIRPTPIPAITGPNLVCGLNGETYVVTNFVAGNTYQWTVSGGFITSVTLDAKTIQVQWGNGTTGIITLTAISPAGCDSTITMNITIRPTPSVFINGPVLVCSNHNAFYYGRYLPGYTYNWNVSGGTFQLIHDSMIQVTWGKAGLGQVSLQVISPALCDSSYFIPIIIRLSPSPIITGANNICAHTSETYWVANFDTSHMYEWSVTGGAISFQSPDKSSIQVLWGVGPTGTVSLKDITPVGCDSLINLNIQIRSRPIPSIAGNNPACTGMQNYIYSADPVGDYIYEWTIPGANIVSGNGLPNVQLNWMAQGMQLITLRMVDNSSLCDTTIELLIKVDSTVKPVVATNSFSGCIPLTVQFNATPSMKGIAYSWDFGDGVSSILPNPTHVYISPGSFEVKVKSQSTFGCVDSATNTVKTAAVPIADFAYYSTNNPIYVLEDTVTFENQSIGGNRYHWVFGDGMEDSAFNTYTIYQNPGKFWATLFAIDTASGCENSITKPLQVKVRELLFAPNAFTPNQDGDNDYFWISVTNIVDFKIIIFDRWGKILYESRDTQFKWDGTYMNEPVQCDVFGYMVEGRGYNGTLFTQTGTVTLLR